MASENLTIKIDQQISVDDQTESSSKSVRDLARLAAQYQKHIQAGTQPPAWLERIAKQYQSLPNAVPTAQAQAVTPETAVPEPNPAQQIGRAHV